MTNRHLIGSVALLALLTLATASAGAVNVTGTTFAYTPNIPLTTTVATFLDSNPLANKSNRSAVQ